MRWQIEQTVPSRASTPSPAVNNRDYVVCWGRLEGRGDVIAGEQIGEGPIEVLIPTAVIPDGSSISTPRTTVAFVGSPAIIRGDAIFTIDRKGLPYASRVIRVRFTCSQGLFR